jgi:hypothetical protein
MTGTEEAEKYTRCDSRNQRPGPELLEVVGSFRKFVASMLAVSSIGGELPTLLYLYGPALPLSVGRRNDGSLSSAAVMSSSFPSSEECASGSGVTEE